MADLPLTSSPYSDVPQPAAEWFTRLISPLTHVYSSAASPSATNSVAMLSPIAPGDLHGFGNGFDVGVGVGDEVGSTKPFASAPIPHPQIDDDPGDSTVLLVLIPILAVIFTILIGLVVFLIAMLYMRKKRGIRLTEDGGPLDLSRGDGVIGEGGVEGVEARWLEGVEQDVKEAYRRAKEWQAQYPPASVPSDITLTQFLSIQEKGVSAWSFEPDYEDNLSLYVQSRTEITFLADGPGMPAREGGGNSVLANLPLPKLNEVYYWEVKMYDKPPNTEVAIGLATKPYPSFRLPGWNRFSVAYFASDGFKSHNYPFTASSHGPPLAEGDVLGVGYRPRTGTVFFTRNGRKMDDAYTGLQRYNLFPTVGANGPCTLHVNLGQAGFVFIEANVKKWGLAPMVGTLAPPPAYGSERGSILLDAGYGTPGAGQTHLGVGALLEAARARSAQFGSSAGSSAHGRMIPGARASPGPGAGAQPQSPRSSNSSRRHRRAGRAANLAGSIPAVPSPLRATEGGGGGGPGPATTGSRRRALGRASAPADDDTPRSYVSPTDTPQIAPRVPSVDADALEHLVSEEEDEDELDEDGSDSAYGSTASEAERSIDSHLEHNPPTPNLLDISLHSLRNTGNYFGNRPSHDEQDGSGSGESDETARPSRLTIGPPHSDESPPPPGYAPLDPHVYSTGLPADLPEDLINQAIAAMSGESQPLNPDGHPGSPAQPRGPLSWFRRG